MPMYNYTALDSAAKKVRGELMAMNEMDLEDRLKGMHLDLITCKSRKIKEGKTGSVKTKDLLVLCMHLEQLDKAGVPLLESLSDVRESTESPVLKSIMTDVYENVKNGNLLSESMAKHPKAFNSVFVGLIGTGEKTGRLADALHHIGEHTKWVADLKRKVKKATKYPAFLLLLIVGVVSVMMIFVVPKLLNFITSQGFSIPIHTKALIAFSNAFTNYWYLMLGVPMVSAITVIVLHRVSESFAYMVDRLLLKTPIFGQTLLKMDLARFTQFFGVMFRSGVDMIESLSTAQGVVRNRVIRDSVTGVKKSVSEGNSLTLSLRNAGHFPPLVVRMFKVGEDSGNMEDALENINYFYGREVNDAVDAIIGFIQPALTIVLGVMMAWIVSAIFGPLYESFSKMKT